MRVPVTALSGHIGSALLEAGQEETGRGRSETSAADIADLKAEIRWDDLDDLEAGHHFRRPQT